MKTLETISISNDVRDVLTPEAFWKTSLAILRDAGPHPEPAEGRPLLKDEASVQSLSSS
jgi:hypothetical protein